MTRARFFFALLVLAPVAVWTSCASEPRAEPGPAALTRPLDIAFDWQARVICDWPAMAKFEVDGRKIPVEGRPCLVVVPAAGEDPAALLREVAGAAGADVRTYWAAPDAATDEAARKAGVPRTAGAVAPEIGAAIPVPIRPALLVLGPNGEIRHAHFPGSAWDPLLWKFELGEIAYEIDFEARVLSARRFTPKSSPGLQGALACAGCHRREFKDWLMTPHSSALEDLVHLDRDTDRECIGCHVVGWEKGGYSDRDKHRALADVQCEACHLPERTHSLTKPMQGDDYYAVCGSCHTQNFSFFKDFKAAKDYVSHPQRDAAVGDPKVNYEARHFFIGRMKDQMYLEVCGKTDYVGSAKCRECHTKEHEQWAGTAHGKAFGTLVAKGSAEDPKCLPCHSTGYGLKTGFTSEAATPQFKDVGCESCHGPGLKHIEAKTDEERRTTIFSFDQKCPTCVIERICLTCHDEHKRPCLSKGESPFDLTTFGPKIRHLSK
ncbi:MAG: hypothetical protein K8T20_12195 [Planctomycetes bacterium]|nr:hypothetical protein [Planctomycetota bacterium]